MIISPEFTAAFNRDFSKKPLFFSQALKKPAFKISTEEFLYLAMQEEFSPVLFEGDARSTYQFRCSEGPLSRQTLQKLGDTSKSSLPWTIVLRNVDKFLPDAAAFIDGFSDLPMIPYSDVMITLSSTYSGVGPHFDSYDVLLVGMSGKKQWSIGEQVEIHDREILVPDHSQSGQEWTSINGYKIMPNFMTSNPLNRNYEPSHAIAVHEQHEGDIIAIPHGFPHHGIASTPYNMTLSIGFLAPLVREIDTDQFDNQRLYLPGLGSENVNENRWKISDALEEKTLDTLIASYEDRIRFLRRLKNLPDASAVKDLIGNSYTRADREFTQEPHSGLDADSFCEKLKSEQLRRVPGIKILWQVQDEKISVYSAGNGPIDLLKSRRANLPQWFLALLQGNAFTPTPIDDTTTLAGIMELFHMGCIEFANTEEENHECDEI